MMDLWTLEHEIYDEGFRLLCGVDEAGRGPLAGPVCAAAVILPVGLEIPGLNDSKQLSEKRREALYDEIMEKAVAAGVGIVGPGRIDEINILQADYEAMCEALGKLSVMPAVLLNDAVTIPQVRIRQVPIISQNWNLWESDLRAAACTFRSNPSPEARRAAREHPARPSPVKMIIGAAQTLTTSYAVRMSFRWVRNTAYIWKTSISAPRKKERGTGVRLPFCIL